MSPSASGLRIPTPRGPAPARRAELQTARRRTLVITLMIAVFFGGSLVIVHRLTDRPAPVASSPPSPDTSFQAAAPDPPTAPRPAAVAAPSSSKPAPRLAAWPSLPAAPVSIGPASSIEVSFKLDPRLTRGLGMGDRWVSPPTYTSAALTGADVTIEARARARDSSGRPMKDVKPVWTPADPGMVAVAPAERGAVRITVKRAGRSDVTVTSGRVAKKLTVAAVQERGVWRVDIAQR